MSGNVDLLRTNLRKGQQFTHQEANVITSSIKAIWKSFLNRGFIDSSGISTRTPNPKTAGAARRAFVKTTPGAVETVVCWLSDTDGVGEEITVSCDIVGGTALNAAVPRLADGEPILVEYVSGNWRCTALFQASQDC